MTERLGRPDEFGLAEQRFSTAECQWHLPRHVLTFRERGNVTEGALDRFSPCSASRTSELKQPLAAYAEAKQAQNANLGLAEGTIDVNFSALRS